MENSPRTIPEALSQAVAEETVEFRNLPLPPLDQKTSVTVEVDPVPSETTTVSSGPTGRPSTGTSSATVERTASSSCCTSSSGTSGT